jgi:putative PIN family toxin of toxin-antitoxin system
MKVVVDTNVAISGLLWSGPPNQILRWARDGFLHVLACEETTIELSRVAKYRRFAKRLSGLGLSPAEVVAYFMNLVSFVPTPRVIPNVIRQDPSDNLFLALASGNGASLIVSGDTHLLSLKEYELIQIVTPGEACEVIQRLIA